MMTNMLDLLDLQLMIDSCPPFSHLRLNKSSCLWGEGWNRAILSGTCCWQDGIGGWENFNWHSQKHGWGAGKRGDALLGSYSSCMKSVLLRTVMAKLLK